MSISIKILYLAVIGPLVTDVKGGCDGATIRIGAMVAEDFFVQVLVLKKPKISQLFSSLKSGMNKVNLTKSLTESSNVNITI